MGGSKTTQFRGIIIEFQPNLETEMSHKVKLKTRKSASGGKWTTVVTEVNGGSIIGEVRRVTSFGHIVLDGVDVYPGNRKFHSTREDARDAVRKLQTNFPGTQYVGGLH